MPPTHSLVAQHGEGAGPLEEEAAQRRAGGRDPAGTQRTGRRRREAASRFRSLFHVCGLSQVEALRGQTGHGSRTC